MSIPLECLPAQPDDAAVLDRYLRLDNRAEVLAYAPPGWEVEIVQQWIENAVESYTIWQGEYLVGMFGYYVKNLAGDCVYPWGLSTDDPRLEIGVRAYYRFARAYCFELVNQFGRLENKCRQDNIVVHRWLRMLGCTVLHNTVCAISPCGVPLVRYYRNA